MAKNENSETYKEIAKEIGKVALEAAIPVIVAALTKNKLKLK